MYTSRTNTCLAIELLMSLRLPSQKDLAGLVMVSLASLTALGSVSGPPEAAIADLSEIDDGAIVRIRGVAVDVWSSDASVVSLVLADLEKKSTAKVVCSQGMLQIRTAFHIGDEVQATGEIEASGGRPVLWCTANDVKLLRPSREVLTLGDLADAWELLVGDRFEVVGILVADSGTSRYRLAALDDTITIGLEVSQSDCYRYLDRKVLADAMLELRPETMELSLRAFSISASP